MCFCVAFFSVIVSVVGSNDREAQLALSASAPNLNRLTQCRCPPPPLAPQWKTLDCSRASFIAFKWRRRSRAPIKGSDQYHDPHQLGHSGLEERERGVNQTLTDDPTAKLPAPTKGASDGWRLKIALVACLYIRIIISQQLLVLSVQPIPSQCFRAVTQERKKKV